MGGFVKGDVVVIPFPFSDLSSSKRRPALVVAVASSRDLIVAQITSQSFRDGYAIAISVSDFLDGGIKADSNVRPNILFTIDANLIAYKAGALKIEKTNDVTSAIIKMLSE